MTGIKIPKINYQNTEKKFLVDSRLRICIECGHSEIDHLEFGLSCENCGTLHVFKPSKKVPAGWMGVEA